MVPEFVTVVLVPLAPGVDDWQPLLPQNVALDE
jgi:hypothetical protein